MRNLFLMTSGAIKSLFTNTTPALSGAPAKAVTGVADNFVGIGNILIEGGVSEDYGSVALQKLHEAQLAVNFAIEHGWNNGKGVRGQY